VDFQYQSNLRNVVVGVEPKSLTVAFGGRRPRRMNFDEVKSVHLNRNRAHYSLEFVGRYERVTMSSGLNGISVEFSEAAAAALEAYGQAVPAGSVLQGMSDRMKVVTAALMAAILLVIFVIQFRGASEAERPTQLLAFALVVVFAVVFLAVRVFGLFRKPLTPQQAAARIRAAVTH